MKLKKMIALLLAAASLTAILSGCGGNNQNDGKVQDDNNTGNPQVSGPQEPGKSQKTNLVVAQVSDAITMDPQKQGTMTTMNILINIFDTLVTRDENGNLAPALATEWKAIDELTWQFKLREGVKFHNGEDFNAEAAKFSLDRLLDQIGRAHV